MNDIEQRARELLAKLHDDAGWVGIANEIRLNSCLDIDQTLALAAVRAALSQQQAVPEDVVRDATALADAIEKNGEWDDGCFYYNKCSASELQTPLANLRRALATHPQPAAAEATATHTTGHCHHNAQPGGCQLHNLQCGWPNCDRKPAGEVQL